MPDAIPGANQQFQGSEESTKFFIIFYVIISELKLGFGNTLGMFVQCFGTVSWVAGRASGL